MPYVGRTTAPFVAEQHPDVCQLGLGFDTATEVGLLGTSATQAEQGMSPWQVLVFPALFTAGMALVDTTDNVLMVGAYGCAFVNPLRKLWYNLTITAAFVLVALFIGGIETLGLLGDQPARRSPFWNVVSSLSGSLRFLGFAVVGLGPPFPGSHPPPSTGLRPIGNHLTGLNAHASPSVQFRTNRPATKMHFRVWPLSRTHEVHLPVPLKFFTPTSTLTVRW